MCEDLVDEFDAGQIAGDLGDSLDIFPDLLQHDRRQGVNICRDNRMTVFEEGDHYVGADQPRCSSDEDVHIDRCGLAELSSDGLKRLVNTVYMVDMTFSSCRRAKCTPKTASMRGSKDSVGIGPAEWKVRGHRPQSSQRGKRISPPCRQERIVGKLPAEADDSLPPSRIEIWKTQATAFAEYAVTYPAGAHPSCDHSPRQ